MAVREVVVHQLSSDGAADLVASVLSAARDRGLRAAVAVVDESGCLLAFGRDRDTFPASIELAIAKARTAATFRRDTQAMQRSLEDGRASYLAMPGALPLAGGVPLAFAGSVVGGLGVSGASSVDDAALALAGARAAHLAGADA